MQSGVGMRRAKANLFGRAGREPPKTRPVRRAGRAGGAVRFSPGHFGRSLRREDLVGLGGGTERRITGGCLRFGVVRTIRRPCWTAVVAFADLLPTCGGALPPSLLCGEESGGRLCARVAGGGSVSFGGRRRGNPGRPLTVRRGVAACNAGSERAARTAGGCGPRGAADSGPRALQRGIGPLAGPARGMRHEAARPFAGAFVFVNRMCYLCLPKRITRLC